MFVLSLAQGCSWHPLSPILVRPHEGGTAISVGRSTPVLADNGVVGQANMKNLAIPLVAGGSPLAIGMFVGSEKLFSSPSSLLI